MKKNLRRYLITMVSFFIFGMLLAIYILDCDWHYTFNMNIHRIAMGAFLCGVGAFLVESGFVNAEIKEKSILPRVLFVLGKSVAYIGVFVFAVVLAWSSELISGKSYLWGISDKTMEDMANRLTVGYVLICAAMGAWFIYTEKKRENRSFTFGEYVSRVIANLSKIFILYLVLILGGVFVVLVAEELLLSGRYEWTAFWMYLVTGAYLCPATVWGIVNVDKENGKFVRAVFHYIYPILTLFSLFFVYLYSVKILVKWEMPSNEAYSIVSVLFCFCMPIWMMAEALKKQNIYSKFLSGVKYIFAPLILLQIYCISVRIYEYGMTPERYLGVMLIVFEVIAIVISCVWKNKKEICLLIFSGLVLISVFAPNYNMYSFSNLWQYSVLKTTYEKVDAGNAITEKEHERLTGSYYYLRRQDETYCFTQKYDIYAKDFVVKFIENSETPEEIEQYDSYYLNYEKLISEMDVSEYETIEYFSVYKKDISEEDVIDLEKFEVVMQNGVDTFYADISAFVKKCMEIDKNDSYAANDEVRKRIKKLNIIPIDETHVMYIQEVTLDYDEGIKAGEEFFQWNYIAITGFMAEKSHSAIDFNEKTHAIIETCFIQEWQKVYYHTLRDWYVNAKENENINIGYFLYDFDNDTVPELVRVDTTATTADGDCVTAINGYTCKLGQVENYENPLISLENCTDGDGRFFLEIDYERIDFFDCDTILPIVEYETGVGTIYKMLGDKYEPFTYPDWEMIIEDRYTQVYAVYADGIDKGDIGFISLEELMQPGVLTTEDSGPLYVAEFDGYKIGNDITQKESCVLFLKEENGEDIINTVILNKEDDIIYAYCMGLDGTWENLCSESTPQDIFYNGTDVIGVSFYGNECYTYHHKQYTSYMNQLSEIEYMAETYLPNKHMLIFNLPPNVEINTICTGDIGNDGQNDIAVVFEYSITKNDGFYPYLFNDRVIRIYTENSIGQYECRFANDFIILNKHYGGVFGDPFVGISIEDGLFVITHYGGSADRWGYEYYYELKDGKMFKCREIESEHYIHDIDSYVEEIYEYDENDAKYTEFEDRW